MAGAQAPGREYPRASWARPRGLRARPPRQSLSPGPGLGLRGPGETPKQAGPPRLLQTSPPVWLPPPEPLGHSGLEQLTCLAGRPPEHRRAHLGACMAGEPCLQTLSGGTAQLPAAPGRGCVAGGEPCALGTGEGLQEEEHAGVGPGQHACSDSFRAPLPHTRAFCTQTQELIWPQPRDPGRNEAILRASAVSICNPMDCSPPGSSVPGILQARTLEWEAMPSSRGSSRPRDRTRIS